MILTRESIQDAINEKSIIITPFDSECLTENAYDIHLGPNIGWYTHPEGQEFDTKKDNTQDFKIVSIPEEGFVLMPEEFYLGVTKEFTFTPQNVPFIEGSSSAARAGFTIHITAGFGEIGFGGHWTLEIKNTQKRPVRIYAGMHIGKMIFYIPDKRVTGKGYKGSYGDAVFQENPMPVPTSIHKKVEKLFQNLSNSNL
jgi:dCTP deaminase